MQKNARPPLRSTNSNRKKPAPKEEKPKVPLPPNPITRQNAKPPISVYECPRGVAAKDDSESKENFLKPLPQSTPKCGKTPLQTWSPQVPHHLEDSHFGYQEMQQASETFDIRRETFVAMPPSQDLKRETYVTLPKHEEKRQTYVPSESKNFQLPVIKSTEATPEKAKVDLSDINISISLDNIDLNLSPGKDRQNDEKQRNESKNLEAEKSMKTKDIDLNSEKVKEDSINLDLSLSPVKDQSSVNKIPEVKMDLSVEKVHEELKDQSIEIDLNLSPQKVEKNEESIKVDLNLSGGVESRRSSTGSTDTYVVRSQSVGDLDELAQVSKEQPKYEISGIEPLEPQAAHPPLSPVNEEKEMDDISMMIQKRLSREGKSPEKPTPPPIEDSVCMPAVKNSTSFLYKTMGEASFMPPSPGRQCSTGVKNKVELEPIQAERSSEIRRDLFGNTGTATVVETSGNNLSSGTYVKSPSVEEETVVQQLNVTNTVEAPVIVLTSPKVDDVMNASSETYVKSPAVNARSLSTIAEGSEEKSLKEPGKNQTFDKENSSASLNKSKNKSLTRSPKAFNSSLRSPTPRGKTPLASSPKPTKKDAVEKGLFFVSFDAKTTKTQTKSETAASKSAIATRTMSRVKPAPTSTTAAKVATKRLALVKPVTKVVRHPNPFATRNTYYDERWVEKQENGFKKWLNFILTPPEGFEVDTSAVHASTGKLDVAKLWSACSKDVQVPRAPTREVLSLRAYSVINEMNVLRRDACCLWQSPAVAHVAAKIESEVERYMFRIRDSVNIQKDVGMKKKALMLLLNYNPLWLRIGLETIYGEVIQMSGSANIVTLANFIVMRLLSNPDILSQFAHKTVPHLYLKGHEDAMQKFTLAKILHLIWFLDQAKTFKIIKHNPCLFNKDSAVKSSKAILIALSRDFLSGEGDVVTHLSYLGYKVKQEQTALDEFDYAVTNVAVDLKDGVRLCRAMEILTNESLTGKLRMPAISKFQRIHNVDISLASLKKSVAGLPAGNITSRDIVAGHMEKTLELLWHIIFGFQMSKVLSESRLEKEIAFLKKSLSYRVQIKDEGALVGHSFLNQETQSTFTMLTKDEWTNQPRMVLLLQWARLVCAHYGIEVENFSVSFSDGRALCFLVHHYYPSFLPRDGIMMQTSHKAAARPSVDKELYQQLAKNEKSNFKLLHKKVSH